MQLVLSFLNKFISHTVVVMNVQHHCVVYPCLLLGIAIYTVGLKKENDLSLAAL